ncbi:TetR/AcrR family transcriptional regulator [Halobacterium noricense]|uniref:TetR/AcrR family transcriptional regulator n=1 Tax=Halobacterium noricense TaxID=223182 RepID=UPI001E4A0168|nr:TetR/AcrR family transcriptional regulator [Halobacterium noricense]UHH24202.1 TetR/AcrR family transcriptional regulator [Halobacterium noricense]
MAAQPTDEILDATYRALCEHGFADLTVQDIADNSEKSKATIHYHYDSKQDLFEAFLEYLYDDYIDHVDDVSGETHREHLLALVEFSLAEGGDVPGIDFRTAMLEIKAQAPYDGGFRKRLTDFDQYLTDRIETVVEAGVEAGEFRADVDPETTAEFLVTTIKGAHTRRVSVNHPLDRIRETLAEYVETRLVADGAEVSA